MTRSGHTGLGSALLNRLCRHSDIELPPVDQPEQVRIDVETGSVERRADLVIEMPAGRIVIENKVDAGEQAGQCAELVSLYDRGDTRFVFLSPDGRTPRTAAHTASKWVVLEYATLANWLRETLDAPALPEHSLLSYLATLENSIT